MIENKLKKLVLFIVVNLVVLTINAQSVGGVTSGSAAYCAGNNSGFVSLTGYVGTILLWQSSDDAGTTWVDIPNPTSSQSYLNLTQTTYYRAVVQDGSFSPDTSTISIITIYPEAEGGVISGAGSFCQNSGAGNLVLSSSQGSIINWLMSIDNGGTWTTINDTSSSINHPNITQNTWYAAVVENIPVCPKDTSVIAKFQINPVTESGSYSNNDSTVCKGLNGDTIQLSGQVGTITDWLVSNNNGATWSLTGNTTDTLTYSELETSVWYQTIVQSGVCNADTTDILKITAVEPNPVEAGEGATITQFQTLLLNGSGVGSPVWSPAESINNPFSFTPEVKPLETTNFVIALTDSNYCISYDTVTVKVIVPVPNAITPNGDGANDYFIVDKIENFKNSSLEIYNRYGNLLYQEAPYENKWGGQSKNGADLPDGIYYYVLKLDEVQEVQTGYVLIKR